MARRDVRTLRDTAAAASSEGKHRKALECYLELEQLEPQSPDWAKRAAETYRRLGKNREAIAAYDRAVDRYVQSGFLVQAIAVCKVILQIDPGHEGTKQRLSQISQQVGKQRFERARELLAKLVGKLGEDDPEVTRIRTLLDFMEGD